MADQLQTVYTRGPKHDDRLPYWQRRMSPEQRRVWLENQKRGAK